MAEELSDEVTTRRSRREKRKSKATSALEKIKLSRQTGIRLEEDLETTDGIFDYVTEDDYFKLVQERQQDQWIMDDDGTYREHGREIFDEEVSSKDNTSTKNIKKPVRKVGKPSSDIKSMVLGMGGVRKRGNDSGTVSVKGDMLLNDILSQIDNQPPAPKRPKPVSFTPRSSVPNPIPHSLTLPKKRPSMIFKKVRKVKEKSPPMDNGYNGGQFEEREHTTNTWGEDDIEQDFNDAHVCLPTSLSPTSEMTGNDIMDTEEIVDEDKITPKQEPVPEEAVSTSGWETIREEIKSQAPPTKPDIEIDTKSLPLIDEEGGDKILHFYWLDVYEDYYRQPGTVYMFGKVWVEEAHTHVSCCVTVHNIERCLYFLPREKILSKSATPTDNVTMKDVYTEFNDKYAEKYHIMKFSSRRVEKKYAFEFSDVPRESEYLEVRYSTDHPAPPSNASGKTFSRVFGTTTSSLERLIISCKLKGPCWLHIRNPSLPSHNISWCKIECIADSLSSVGVASEQAPPPPLTILSLSMKTLLNTRTRINEILCIGSLVHNDVSLDKPPSTPFQTDFCVIRRPNDRHFPMKFQEHMEKKNIRLEVNSSERGLLAFFLAKLAKVDPDILIGHNLSSQWLDTLQHRLHVCKVPSWSRIGRLRRQNMPKGRGVTQSLCCGRLILDVKTSAKELIRARSYDLSELVSSVLGRTYRPWDDEEVLSSFGSLDTLSNLVSHTMDEAFFSLTLTHELCVLPLAYQITCIAGNALGRTLQGGRSERNEFLLLHAFTQKGYIPPDRLEGSRKSGVPSEDGEGVVSKRNKPTYAGGLVLEPKVGFYNRLILLLDFNSLYPSIIQEYNICFTTVDHTHCTPDDDFTSLQLPGDTQAQGILPSEIRVLVERRRQVKQLMKTASSPEQYQHYDIRQKALKLTANSMYGCLGFSNSRFYARPLAAIVTGKGREILAHTKDLATKLGLDVIYGDTDSIMIDSGTQDLKEADLLAQKVKQEVNKLYRLLEIDIDGIFKCMLLLKKKKYAAISLIKKEGVLTEHKELKGLDIVRRDWCDLAKRAGNYILDQILSGKDYDSLIETVQTFLSKLSGEVRNNETDIQEFVITKALTKLPKDYPDKKSLPHVQVAMRMISRNQHVQPGDVIPYVICESEEAGQLQAQRSFHPNEVARQQLKVDFQYYLQHQVHAVVSRLCAPIQGLEPAELARWLGLDPSLYSRRTETQDEQTKATSLLPGGVVMDNADPLKVQCLKSDCTNFTELTGTGSFSCTVCNTSLPVSHIRCSLIIALRYYVSKYYRGTMICDDGHKTISTPLNLQCHTCGKKIKEEYSSGSLYAQLLYFKNFFSGVVDPEYRSLEALVKAQLDQNAYTNVSLGFLFPKLRD